MCVLNHRVICLTFIKSMKTIATQSRVEVGDLPLHKERKIDDNEEHVFTGYPIPPEVKLFIKEFNAIYSALLKKAGCLNEGKPSLYDFTVTLGPDGYPVIEKIVDLSDLLSNSDKDEECEENEDEGGFEVIEDNGYVYLIAFTGSVNGIRVSLGGVKAKVFRGDEVVAEGDVPQEASTVEEISVNNGVLVIKYRKKEALND